MKIFTYILLLTILFSCKQENTYKKHNAGFEYKMILQNKNSKKIKLNDILEIDLKYTTEYDSVIFNSNANVGKFRIKVETPNTGGIFQNAILMLNQGDNAKFIINANNFYSKTLKKDLPTFLNSNSNLKFDIKIKKIVSEKDIEKEYETHLLNLEIEEKTLLNEYLKNENINIKPTKSGLYIIKLKKGNGKKAKIGQIATIHYKGSFINGKIISSSINKGKPYKFKIGNDEVIKAWDEAILQMKVGDKVRIIVPSDLAYGKLGYKNKIPPFSTLIFDIKLLKLN